MLAKQEFTEAQRPQAEAFYASIKGDSCLCLDAKSRMITVSYDSSPENCVKAIMTKLDLIFSDMDQKVLASTQSWAAGRKEALVAYKASDEYKALTNCWDRADKTHALCGGKTWFNVFNLNGMKFIEDFVEKNCRAIAEKRNAKITKKLIGLNIKSVSDSTFTHTSDGFDGVFRVTTELGEKVITINTILAGGYNIQCLHMRVLTKIK